MKKWFSTILGITCLLVLVSSARAQAVYTAERKTRIQAGAGGMYLNNDYSDRAVYGISAWGDYDFNRYIGAEAEVHFGTIITPDDISENSYLIGPKLSYRRQKFAVYGKLMIGKGTIKNTDTNGSATYNLYAFGGGLDYHLVRKFNIRVIDFELQKWPDFEPNTLSPLAVSIGVMYIIR